MNEIVVQEPSSFSIVPVAEIQARTRAIKKLISEAMVENVDFGVIPGTQKKSLWKSGAEKICAMFRIADRYSVDDLSSGNVIRYRVTCQGISASGEVLGEGMGEASTAEEKFRWRKAVCDEEFDDTPETHRRVKYARGQGGSHYKVKQVMTNEADSANTILKMAQKRAKLGMVLGVTACSDDFTQDVVDEDTPPAERDDTPPPGPRAPKAKPPAGKPPGSAPAEVGLGERKWIERKVEETGADLQALLDDAGIATLADLTPEAFVKIKAALT